MLHVGAGQADIPRRPFAAMSPPTPPPAAIAICTGDELTGHAIVEIGGNLEEVRRISEPVIAMGAAITTALPALSDGAPFVAPSRDAAN